MAEERSTDTPRGFRITRVYSRQGDGGASRLADGSAVRKDDPRLESLGAIDELQSFIAAARDALAAAAGQIPPPVPAVVPLIGEHLAYIQNLLFTVGAQLATPAAPAGPAAPPPPPPATGPDQTRYLEELIDALRRPLPPLRDFVLCGGHPAVTALHLCRVVCRRAERTVVAAAAAGPIGEGIIPFLNRLSDALFVMARRVDRELRDRGLAGEETIWRRERARPPLPE